MKKNKPLLTFVALACFFNTLIVAQTDTLLKEKTTFGVAFAYTQGYYKIKKANWEANGLGDTLSGLSQKSQGFSLAIQLNFPISSKLAVRVKSGFSFDDLTMIFFRKDGKNRLVVADNIYLDIPVDLVYTFTEGKIKPSLIFGLRYLRSIENSVGTRFYKKNMALFSNDFGFYIGTGINKTLRKFTIRPEVAYYFSPFNILQSENLFYPFKAISSINRNYFDLRINVFRKTT